MFTKSRERRSGERIVKALGPRLDYGVWTPVNGGPRAPIHFLGQTTTIGMEVVLTPQNGSWLIYLGWDESTQTSSFEPYSNYLCDFDVNPDNFFDYVNSGLDWVLATGLDLPLSYRQAAVDMKIKTATMVGNIERVSDGSIQNLKVLLEESLLNGNVVLTGQQLKSVRGNLVEFQDFAMERGYQESISLANLSLEMSDRLLEKLLR